MNNPPKKPVTLPQPPPHVTDPRAARSMQRAASAIPKYNDPRAGGPTPPVPLLDAEAVPGQTMSQQAQHARPMPQQGGSIIEPAMYGAPEPYRGDESGDPRPPPPIAPPGGPLNILPTDTLPPEATQDPHFQNGFGALYASSQPDLARKYGVIRNNQHIPPQALGRPSQPNPPGARPPSPKSLSPETIEGLKTFDQLQRQSQQSAEQQQEKKIEDESRAGVAGAAAGLGTGLSEKKPTPEMMSEMDLDTLHQRMVQDMLQNDEQRAIVEERLAPLDLGELVMNGVITQVVPIIPGKFEPEFQSLAADDDLGVKRLIVGEANSLKVDDRYLLDKFAIMGVACALKSINKKPLPDHRDEKGQFDDEKFWAKFNRVVRFPLPMLASLGVHYFYFDVRVRKLFVAEKVKNG